MAEMFDEFNLNETLESRAIGGERHDFPPAMPVHAVPVETDGFVATTSPPAGFARSRATDPGTFVP